MPLPYGETLSLRVKMEDRVEKLASISREKVELLVDHVKRLSASCMVLNTGSMPTCCRWSPFDNVCRVSSSVLRAWTPCSGRTVSVRQKGQMMKEITALWHTIFFRQERHRQWWHIRVFGARDVAFVPKGSKHIAHSISEASAMASLDVASMSASRCLPDGLTWTSYVSVRRLIVGLFQT